MDRWIAKRRKEFWIDAELRNDAQVALVSFRAQDVGCLCVARDRVIGVMENVRFDPGRWRRIVAQDILPGKKERFSARVLRGAQREKAGKIIGFFVYVNQIRLKYLSHSPVRI